MIKPTFFDHNLYKLYCSFFFFNDTATTEIYTLSLHDALPIPQLDEQLIPLLGRKCCGRLVQDENLHAARQASSYQHQLRGGNPKVTSPSSRIDWDMHL